MSLRPDGEQVVLSATMSTSLCLHGELEAKGERVPQLLGVDFPASALKSSFPARRSFDTSSVSKETLLEDEGVPDHVS